MIYISRRIVLCERSRGLGGEEDRYGSLTYPSPFPSSHLPGVRLRVYLVLFSMEQNVVAHSAYGVNAMCRLCERLVHNREQRSGVETVE